MARWPKTLLFLSAELNPLVSSLASPGTRWVGSLLEGSMRGTEQLPGPQNDKPILRSVWNGPLVYPGLSPDYAEPILVILLVSLPVLGRSVVEGGWCVWVVWGWALALSQPDTSQTEISLIKIQPSPGAGT